MEFLRFGSSIPGSYWGCCAVCIIQNFSQGPDEKASIELVDGDGGVPLVKNGKSQFLGKTWREIFESRLRIGTFSSRDMPNHAFLAVLTDDQIRSNIGKEWLKILKESGFEFIRTIDNSVYSGKHVIKAPGAQSTSAHPNYLFGLFRNIGKGAIADPYTPPKQWTDLPSVAREAWNAGEISNTDLNVEAQAVQLALWNASSPAKLYTEEELEKDGVPIWLAGRRSDKPQELKSCRKTTTTTTIASTSSPFGKTAVALEPIEDTCEIFDDGDYDDDSEWDM